MNDLIINNLHLEEEDVMNINVPFAQIMGFEAVLSILAVKYKGVDVVEDLVKFRFPTTKKRINKVV